MAHTEPQYENKQGGAVHDGQDPHKHEGVYGNDPAPPQIDIAAIPPNNPRPSEGSKAEHLFNGWSD